MATNGDWKSTGSNFGCTFQLSAFHISARPHSFSQSSSDGTVTSASSSDYGGTSPRVSSSRTAFLSARRGPEISAF
jgi:hypothetical protein